MSAEEWKTEVEAEKKRQEDEIKKRSKEWEISILTETDPDYKAPTSSEDEAQGSGGAASSSGGADAILNKRRPCTDEELAGALEWKPWYYRPEEPKHVRTIEDVQRHQEDQAERLNKTKELLTNTEGE